MRMMVKSVRSNISDILIDYREHDITKFINALKNVFSIKGFIIHLPHLPLIEQEHELRTLVTIALGA